MLKEAHRVLKKKGKIAVSVWGRPENSEFMTVFAECVKRSSPNTVVDALTRHFKLCNRENLIKIFTENGFSKIESWY